MYKNKMFNSALDEFFAIVTWNLDSIRQKNGFRQSWSLRIVVYTFLLFSSVDGQFSEYDCQISSIILTTSYMVRLKSGTFATQDMATVLEL